MLVEKYSTMITTIEFEDHVRVGMVSVFATSVITILVFGIGS